MSKSLGELPTLARAKVEMATTSLNRQDPNFVEINLLYKKIKALKDFEPSFSIRSLEANSVSLNSRSRVEPNLETAPRVNGAGVFFERDIARRIVPNDLPIASDGEFRFFTTRRTSGASSKYSRKSKYSNVTKYARKSRA